MDLLVVGGADPAQGGVAASQVVPPLDPGEGGRAQRGDCRPGAVLDQLEFVGSVPALDDGVGPRRRLHPIRLVGIELFG